MYTGDEKNYFSLVEHGVEIVKRCVTGVFVVIVVDISVHESIDF